MNARETEKLAKALDMFRAASYTHAEYPDAQPEFYTETQKFARVVREDGRAVGSIAGAKTHNLYWQLIDSFTRDDAGVVSFYETTLSARPMCGTTRSTPRGGHFQNYYGVSKDAQPTCSKCGQH